MSHIRQYELTVGLPTHISAPEVLEHAAEEVARELDSCAGPSGSWKTLLPVLVDQREVVVVAVGRDAGERLRHERRQQVVLAADGGAHLAVGGDVVGGAQRAVEAEVQLELAGGVLVVAVAHVEAEPLAVVDDVEQHRTELLELVDVVAVGLGDALGQLAVLGRACSHIISGSIPIRNW